MLPDETLVSSTLGHWIVAPVLLPAVMAPLYVLAMRFQRDVQQVFSVAMVVALVAMSAWLTLAAANGTVESYELGDWPAPFGIVLVLDRLSALLVLLTSVLALGVLLYVIGTGWDKRGRHFHALFAFQLMGINGAFLTGDMFNLFVFFEVLLIASYGLMIHGGGRDRLRAGVQYVVFNLAGSTLFLFALGAIYSVSGTLNMADIALRVADLPEGDAALVRVAAMLLLLVFAIKAALLPLHFWLPNTYALAPAPVAALFAIMTKVGAYAILRVYTLVFGPDLPATGTLFGDLLMPAAILTMVVGMIGVLGSRQLGRLISFAVIGSMGTLLIAIALFTPEGTVAALYYMIHSTFAAAVLFLVLDLTTERRGAAGDRMVAAIPIAQNGLIAALFFGGAIAMAGLPPLSGFIGKLFVLDAARDHALAVWIWGGILVTSLIAVVGFARAGSIVYWKGHGLPDAPPSDVAPQPVGLPVSAVVGLTAAMVATVIFAGPITSYLDATAEQLFAPQVYIDAVLQPPSAETQDALDRAARGAFLPAYGEGYGDTHGGDPAPAQ